MSETLSRRVGRLISGGFHTLVDSVENTMPEALTQESIRELEETMGEVRSDLGKVLAQKHLASKKMIQESNRHEALNEAIRQALASTREDLAEAGVAEQIDIEARLAVLETSIAECAAQEKELGGFILALQAKQREMQGQLQQWREQRNKGAAPGGEGKAPLDIERQIAQSSNNFNRIWQRQTGLPAQDGKGSQLAKLEELENLTRKNRIQERLAALKNEQ